jgi:hypothetical protein
MVHHPDGVWTGAEEWRLTRWEKQLIGLLK